MSQRVLVTGAAGYLGTMLVTRLLEAGHKVDALDLFPHGDTVFATHCANSNFTPVKGDARIEGTLAPLIAKADVIIPLAALVGAPLCNQDSIGATTTNLDAIRLLVKLASPNQHILYPTTNSGYGIGERGVECTEDTPLKPISLYGTTKTDAEKAVLDSGKGLTFRLATVFGMAPRMRLDLLVNDFTWRAVNDRAVVIFEGHFKRNYIHVRDIAKVFHHGIDNFQAMQGRPYNVGLSDANLSKLELCAEIKKQVPNFVYLEAPIGEDPDKRDYIVSNARIESTGFKPEFSLQRGVEELIKGYKMMRNSRFSNV